MKISTDNFSIPTSLSSSELAELLSQRTLPSKILTMKLTSKDFIGTVNEQEFKLINSWFPIGVACVLTGNLIQDQVELRTTLHGVFRILFFAWAILICGLGTFGLTTTETWEMVAWAVSFIGFLFAAGLFRLFLHGVYVLARNKSIRKLQELLTEAK